MPAPRTEGAASYCPQFLRAAPLTGYRANRSGGTHVATVYGADERPVSAYAGRPCVLLLMDMLCQRGGHLHWGKDKGGVGSRDRG